MGSLAPDAMVRRVYHCLCSIDSGLAAPTGSGKSGSSAACGIGRDQMVIFLADTLRGTSEERAPLVLAMSQNVTAPSATVTCEQVAEVSVDKIRKATQKFGVCVILVVFWGLVYSILIYYTFVNLFMIFFSFYCSSYKT